MALYGSLACIRFRNAVRKKGILYKSSFLYVEVMVAHRSRTLGGAAKVFPPP